MAGPHEIYLIRHAIAETRGDEWPDDTKRPLTEAGRGRLRSGMRGLSRLGVAFDLILTSPLVRARQTAEIVAATLNPGAPIIAAESLAPGGSYTAVLADLQKHARRGAIALVGHEPGIGELTARLIGARRPIVFKKGAVCRVDLDGLPPTSSGALRWFLTPKILRSLRR